MHRFKKFKAISLLIIATILVTPTAFANDQELLDILLQNGVLNKAQHSSLSKKTHTKKTSTTKTQDESLSWTSRIKVSGDLRFRHENIDKNDDNGVKESRQRIRARLKIAAKVNDQVNVGLRLVTGAGTATSANQTLEGSFGSKDVYFDRIYINWQPQFIIGLSATFGKFKQPWYNALNGSSLLWDSDLNPEGVALKYKKTVGFVDLATTAGYFIVEDGDTVKGDAKNDGFSDDLNMYHVGISGTTQISDSIKAALGSNVYIYNNETNIYKKDYYIYDNENNFYIHKEGTLAKAGRSAFELYEVAGRLDFDTPLLPIYVYGQYVTNASADDGKDRAWLAGFGTKYGAFKLDYNYRDVQQYAVVDRFGDDDFADGATASRGHKVKLSYAISKHFATSVTYYAAREYRNYRNYRNANGKKISTDRLQLDLKAKF